jgi:type IV secretory pathway VirJ component
MIHSAKKILFVCFFFLCTAAPLPAVEETVAFGRTGTAHLYYRSSRPAHVGIFLSGDGGWKLGVIDMSRELAATQDVLIIGVDTVSYLKTLDLSADRCSYVVDDFTGLADFVEKRLNYSRHVPPILLGYSSGATLVYAALAQAKADTFAGGISLGFCPDLCDTKIFCKGEGLESVRNPKAAGFLLQTTMNLRNPWIVLQGAVDAICSTPDTRRFVSTVPGGQIVVLPMVGHGFSRPRNWMPQLKQAFRTICGG